MCVTCLSQILYRLIDTFQNCFKFDIFVVLSNVTLLLKMYKDFKKTPTNQKKKQKTKNHHHQTTTKTQNSACSFLHSIIP